MVYDPAEEGVPLNVTVLPEVPDEVIPGGKLEMVQDVALVAEMLEL
tara:strand:+ start:227 stop:364 length:138 start_codon:yes stop_codon:yes gene_type:complete